MNILLIGRALAQPAITTDFGQAHNIEEYVSRVMPFVYTGVTSLAILMIIYAGYVYLTSQGSPDKIGLAKDILVGVIIGLILLFTISLILRGIGTV